MKKHWKKILIISFVFILIYHKYTSDRIINEVKTYLDQNAFMQYQLDEYIDYFKDNGFEYNYSEGEDYLINNALYGDIEYYKVDRCFGIYAKKDGGSVSCDYNESYGEDKNHIFPDAMIRIKGITNHTFPIIYDIELGDHIRDVKKKKGLNFFNTCLPYLRYINDGIDVSNQTITIKNTDKTDYAYLLFFDEEDCLKEIVIFSDRIK